ncbi:Gfo/Idh/MocA family protein [Geomonas azotofigens]|uniref:Gfo/Idh/MocA family protein n=1 Tax=Geomonas azotofigens TaxID=2843196 RepID=UPI001C117177|nr:Gfo/Idh/MocA family oxidoreductase [Geomonas azotofigens]MBU5613366.1 Gfo/Idh/MocA family oxidoreductase [Geomonas azotofigens]
MNVDFAIVGCGAIGCRHAAVVDAERRGSIVSLCDVELGRAKELAEKYGPEIPCFDDFDQMLRHTDASIVNICTPHGLHAEMAIKAANAGKHILVEKPMALTVKDANEMIAAAQANGVHLMVVKQNRFNVPIALTRNALQTGKLGRIFMVKCDVLWNRHDGYYQSSNWRGRLDLEGGALYTQASHFIDLLNWWFGDVVEVEADVATFNHDVEIEDCGNALLKFDSGVMGALTWTTCVYNKNYEGSITIIGEFGTIKIGGPYLNKIEYWDVRALPLQDDIVFCDKPNAYGKYQGTSSNHDKVVTNVVAKLLNERHHVVEGDEGVMSIKAIEMIYAKARRHRGE